MTTTEQEPMALLAEIVDAYESLIGAETGAATHPQAHEAESVR